MCVEWSVYGAFSGEVGEDDGAHGGVATECSLNAGQGCLETAELLVVCNKLETGFDEPRIAAMYVDRCLASARCVQVCSTPRVEDVARLECMTYTAASPLRAASRCCHAGTGCARASAARRCSTSATRRTRCAPPSAPSGASVCGAGVRRPPGPGVKLNAS